MYEETAGLCVGDTVTRSKKVRDRAEGRGTRVCLAPAARANTRAHTQLVQAVDLCKGRRATHFVPVLLGTPPAAPAHARLCRPASYKP